MKKFLDTCRRLLSIALNLFVLCAEPIALPLSWEMGQAQIFTYYTEDSNIFAAVVCWLVAIVTAVSGIKYLWDNRSFINTAK